MRNHEFSAGMLLGALAMSALLSVACRGMGPQPPPAPHEVARQHPSLDECVDLYGKFLGIEVVSHNDGMDMDELRARAAGLDAIAAASGLRDRFFAACTQRLTLPQYACEMRADTVAAMDACLEPGQ